MSALIQKNSPLILMTGARGRLASAFIPYLQQQGFRVVGISREKGDGFFGYDDLETSDLLDRADALIHLAWSTVPRIAEIHQGLEWDEDLPLLIHLLSNIRKLRSPERSPLHFLFFSSIAVYGSKQGVKLDETSEVMPVGWYGLSKLQAEQILQFAGGRHEILPAILRVSNPYGFVDKFLRPQGVIARLIEAVETGSEVSLWGGGEMTKDYIHVDDLSKALVLTLKNKISGLFNIAYGEAVSVNHICALIEKAYGKKINIHVTPGYFWDVATGHVQTQKFSHATDWKIEIRLESGIQRAILDHKNLAQ